MSQSPQQACRWGLFLLIGLLAFLEIIGLTSRRGVAITSDGVSFALMACQLAKSCSGIDNGFSPMAYSWLHFPPLFPFSLAAMHWLGAPDYFGASRWLNAALLGASVLGAGILISKNTGSLLFAGAGMLWMMLSTKILYLHASNMSEPLYLFGTIVWTLLMMDYLSQSGGWRLARTAGVAGLLCLTRFAGIVSVAAGVVMIAGVHGKSPKTRIKESAGYLAISLLPMAGWMTNNFLDKGKWTDREFVPHFFPLRELDLGFCGRLIDFSGLAGNTKIAAFVLTGTTVIAGLALWRDRTRSTLNAVSPETRRFAVLCVAFSIIYLFLLLLTTAFLDAMALDPRLLVPPQLFAVFGLLAVLSVLANGASHLPLTRFTFVVLFLASFCGINAISALPWTIEQYFNGSDYSGPQWSPSATVDAVRKLPANVPIYSNDSHALFIFTGRETAPLVPKVNLIAQKENPAYANAIRKMREDIKNHNAVIVYFYYNPVRHSRSWGCPSLEDLRMEMPLKPVLKTSDGEIDAAGGSPR